MNDDLIRLARRYLRLHKRPYNPETCDANHVELEEAAMALAKAVITEAHDLAHHRAASKKQTYTVTRKDGMTVNVTVPDNEDKP